MIAVVPPHSAERDVEIRRWSGRTADQRAQWRRRELMEAGFDILGNDGAAAVTVRAVARGAGLSSRYFYESFADRDELIRAIFDDRFATVVDAVESALEAAPKDFASQARASIDATAACVEDDLRLGRALLRETIADDALRAHAGQALTGFVASVALRAADPDLVQKIPPRELETLAIAVSSVQVSLLLSWSEGTLQLTREELVEQTLAMILGLAASAGLA